MLAQRIASAIVGIPIIILLILAGGAWFAAAVATVLAIATAEFHLHAPAYRRPLAMLSALFSALLGLAPFLAKSPVLWPLLLTLTVVVLLLWALFFSSIELALSHWMLGLASVVYIGWLGSHLTALRAGPDGRDWVLLTILATWIMDSAAYFAGKTVGRRKLAPRISPGKTAEGAIAGFLVGVITVVALHQIFALGSSPVRIATLAVLVSVMAQLGDLGESLLKRGLQIKDSSRLIPGHGGFLDRLDSILFTTITVYYLNQF